MPSRVLPGRAKDRDDGRGAQLRSGGWASRPRLGGPFRPITRIALAAALTLGFGASAANAHAATISLAVSADPAEERAFTITTSGTADAPGSVLLYIRPAGGAACAATAGTETGGTNLLVTFVSAGGAYTFSSTYTPQAPSGYLLCAYLGSSTTTAAATSKMITVRPNRATLAITAPTTAIPDQPVVLSFHGATEVSRGLFATIKPAGATGCGSAYSTDVGGEDVVYSALQGAYSVRDRRAEGSNCQMLWMTWRENAQAATFSSVI
jgi:hypothetical protein